MDNNHFWTTNLQAPIDINCENNDFISQNPYPLFSPSSNLLFPFFYSPLPFQNYFPHSTHSYIHPNSFSNINQITFQSLPEQKEIKIENNENCCQPQFCHSPFIQSPCQSKHQNKKPHQNSNSSNSSKTKKKQIEGSQNSKNNNFHKKQNQNVDVESPKTYPHIVSQLKTLNSQSSNLLTVKQLTKELIVQTLNCQKPQTEMLMTIKCEIVKLVNQSNKKLKRSIEEFLDDVIKILSLKFTKFKKTKEQMIKYIFRKIFNVRNKPQQIDQNSWKIAQKVHRKNCSSFKSMNMKYVEKQFENPVFIELFSIFLSKFDVNFQKENQDRIDRLNKIVTAAIIYEDLTELKSYKKMPWNKNVVENIQVLFEELRQIQKNAQKASNVFEFMQEGQKSHQIMPQQNFGQKGYFLLRQKTN